MPDTATQVTIGVRLSSAGTAWFDDLTWVLAGRLAVRARGTRRSYAAPRTAPTTTVVLRKR
jgi:hypothetical protein